MARLSKLFARPQKRLAKDAWRLTTVHFILGLAGALSGVFTSTFLWRQSGGLEMIVKYHLIAFPIIPIIFSFIGLALFWVPLRHLMQVGLIFYIAKYTFFIVFRHNVSQAIWFVGLLNGLGTGFYWAGHNTFEYLSTNDKTRDIYYGINSSLGSLRSIVAPAIAGFIVAGSWPAAFLPQDQFTGYYVLFGVVSLILMAAVIYLFQLPSIRPPRIRISGVFEPARSILWRLVNLREFLDGVKGGSAGYVASILAFIILGEKELNLGIFSSLFSFLSAVTAFTVGSVLIKRRQDRLRLGLVGGSLLALARVIYVTFFNLIGMVISTVISVFGGPLFGVGLASTFYDAVDHSPQHKKRFFEYIISREVALASGRVFSASALLLFLCFGNDVTVARVWFLFLGFIPLAFWALTKSFEGRFRS